MRLQNPKNLAGIKEEHSMGKGSAWKDYMLIVLGTAIMAVSVNSVFDPLGMVTGGFSGIAIMVKYLTRDIVNGGIPLWLTTLILNIPVFIIGIKMKGLSFFRKSLVGTVSLSVWLYILPVFPIINHDLILASLYGGVLQGLGIGLAFAGRGTTGGSDMVASLIQMKFRYYSVSHILQFVDGFIVGLGAFVFGVSKVLYAIVAIFVISKVSDGLLEGLKFSKAAFIITGEYEAIAKMLMQRLNRGVTGITVKGMYSKDDKKMLFCVVAKKQIVELKDLVSELDAKAFVIVTDAREVLGEGFIPHSQLEK